MRKFLIVGLLLCAGKAQAQMKHFEVGYASFTVTGVKCSSGTSIEITSLSASTRTLAGFEIVGYRVQNQDASYHGFISNTPNLSTTSVTAAQLARLGERIAKDGGSVTYQVGRDPDRSWPREVRLYCQAEDGSGANGIALSVAAFGIR